MSVKSEQAITVLFTTQAPATGAATDADATPVGTLYVNGTANGATVTETNISTGLYKAAFTLPSLTAGDVVSLRIAATVGGVAGEGVPWQEVSDTERVSDLNDLSAADVNAEVDTALSDIRLDHLVAVADSDDVVTDSIVAKLASTDGDWSAFAKATDSLQSIRDALVASNPQNHSATANTETTGTLDSGTYADTSTVNTTYYQVSPVGTAVGGFGLNVYLTFNIGIGRIPDQVEVVGYFDSGAQRTVHVWAYDHNIDAYVQLSSSINDFGNAGANQTFQYPLTNTMTNVATGELRIRFTATSITTGDDFYCDRVNVTSVAQSASGLTADSIQAAVWARSHTGHDEESLGYNVAKLHLLQGQIESATSAAQFVIDAGVAVNDAYNGMLITLEDKTDDHYEIRRIVDYIGATNEVFVDRAFGFTPVALDDYYITNSAYADVNATHIAGTSQTANDNGADINAILLDTGTDGVLIADDAITSDAFDESSAFPLTATDAGATYVARTGADSDTLETLSDEIAGITVPSAAVVADAVWNELSTGHVDAGKAGQQLWTDVDAILTDTGTDGVALADDAITANKFDESTAFPLTATDSGSTYIARTGADSDTLETLSDQIDDVPTNTELTTAVGDVSVDEIQASALADLFNTDSGTTYAAAVAGSVVKETADNAGGATMSVQDIVDGVWDEAKASHVAASSFGEEVQTHATSTELTAAFTDLDLDHLIQVTAGSEKPTDGSYLDQIMNKDGSQTFSASSDSLEALSDRLTRSAAAGSTDAYELTCFRGDSYVSDADNAIEGLGDISDRTSLWIVVKKSTALTDNQATLFCEETAGITRLNGAAYGTPGNSVITVSDEDAGDLRWQLDEAVTDDLVPGLYHYDIQTLDSSGNVKTWRKVKQFTVSADVARIIS